MDGKESLAQYCSAHDHVPRCPGRCDTLLFLTHYTRWSELRLLGLHAALVEQRSLAEAWCATQECRHTTTTAPREEPLEPLVVLDELDRPPLLILQALELLLERRDGHRVALRPHSHRERDKEPDAGEGDAYPQRFAGEKRRRSQRDDEPWRRRRWRRGRRPSRPSGWRRWRRGARRGRLPTARASP